MWEQVNEAAEIIYDLVDQNANLIFGAVVDPKLGQEVRSLPVVPVVLLYGQCCVSFHLVSTADRYCTAWSWLGAVTRFTLPGIYHVISSDTHVSKP